MKALITASLIFTTTSAFADSLTCESTYSKDHGASVSVTLVENDFGPIANVFETSPEFVSEPKFNGVSEWRYVSKDKSIEVSDNVSGGILIVMTGLDSASASETGCSITGPSANSLFKALHESLHPAITKSVSTHGEIPSHQASLLGKRLLCIDNIYGSPNEVPGCTFGK